MSIETVKYDLVYGKLLKFGINIDKAKILAKTLLDISDSIGTDINEILKNVNQNGLRFDNAVYEKLNSARTNSSQIGYLDRTNIPAAIVGQLPIRFSRDSTYLVNDYVELDYVE